MTTLANPLYLHCSTCIHEESPANIEVAVEGTAIQVWCKNHEKQVCMLTLDKPLAMVCGGEHHGEPSFDAEGTLRNADGSRSIFDDVDQ